MGTVAKIVGKTTMPRREVDTREMHLFELLHTIHQTGWQCWVQPRGGRAPEAYKHGSEKVYWVKASMGVFSRAYMVAFALAESRREPVEHFRAARWYECLVSGERYAQRSRKKMILVPEDVMSAQRTPPPAIWRRRGLLGRPVVRRRLAVKEGPAAAKMEDQLNPKSEQSEGDAVASDSGGSSLAPSGSVAEEVSKQTA